MQIDGETVTGTRAGADFAVLSGRFPPPYAEIGELDDGDLTAEGYGCNPWNSTRRAVHNPRSYFAAGVEIEFDGMLCRGDSGGALWQGGELVGILTAVRTNGDTPTGYATEVPRRFHPPPERMAVEK